MEWHQLKLPTIEFPGMKEKDKAHMTKKSKDNQCIQAEYYFREGIIFFQKNIDIIMRRHFFSHKNNRKKYAKPNCRIVVNSFAYLLVLGCSPSSVEEIKNKITFSNQSGTDSVAVYVPRKYKIDNKKLIKGSKLIEVMPPQCKSDVIQLAFDPDFDESMPLTYGRIYDGIVKTILVSSKNYNILKEKNYTIIYKYNQIEIFNPRMGLSAICSRDQEVIEKKDIIFSCSGRVRDPGKLYKKLILKEIEYNSIDSFGKLAAVKFDCLNKSLNSISIHH